MGGFPRRYLEQEPVPRPTLFVEGPHEDHAWLQDRAKRGELDLVPGLTWLMNGFSTTIGDADCQLQVTGLGKSYSPAGYSNGSVKHYTYTDVQRACSAGPTDILLCHEGVEGEVYGNRRCEAKGIKKILYATRPKLLVHGHFNVSRQYEVLGVPAYSLANGEVLPLHFQKSGAFSELDNR